MTPELLAPAGNLEKLKAAILYGADAVYLGGPKFGLRMRADNFSLEELSEAVKYAHSKNSKVYVTVNIFAHNRDFVGLGDYLHYLNETGVDAIIAADPGVISLARSLVPDLKIHLSTQANTTNTLSASFWQSQGVSRIVLARELSLQEIKEISDNTKVELEVFVHGAMCISYSGRCLLSQYMTGRDANQGDCAQSCRWRYALVEEKRQGQYFPIFQDNRGTYILSSRDLCLLSFLPALIEAKVKSFKIEGRVKSVHYVATVVKVYREAIDRIITGNGDFSVEQSWLDELGKVSNRDYTTAFLSGDSTLSGHGDVEGIYRRNCTFVGLIRRYHFNKKILEVEQRNRFSNCDKLEVLVPGGPNQVLKPEKMYDENGQPIQEAPHPCQTVYIPYDTPLPEFSMLRRIENQ
jgi:putative protease